MPHVATYRFWPFQGYAAIEKIALLLNEETRRKDLLKGQQRRAMLLQTYEATLPDGEHIPSSSVTIHNVTYRFPQLEENVLPEISCIIESGQVVALKGGGSVGKQVMLRLIGRHFTPSEGFIDYPARWRVRFLDATALFFGGDMNKLQTAALSGPEVEREEKWKSMGTLIYNLKFGAQFDHPNHADWDVEIWNLCNLLGMSKTLIGASVEEFTQGEHPKKFEIIGLNGEKLSTSDRALLNIARALLSSVDLLLVSNTFDLLGPERGVHVIGIMKKWTKDRCLECLVTENAATPVHLRKKKTLIYSTKMKEIHDAADNWFAIHPGDEDTRITAL